MGSQLFVGSLLGFARRGVRGNEERKSEKRANLNVKSEFVTFDSNGQYFFSI